jgi:plasmid stabilization system protein ParE
MRVEWLPPAIEDLLGLRDFILPHNPSAARRAVKVIKGTVDLLIGNPGLGKPVAELAGFHDIVIPFGAAGYVLRYRLQADVIYIVALRHGREAGFPEFGE